MPAAALTITPDQFEASTAQAIADCDGDARAAVQVLIVANAHMQAELAALTAEVAQITAKVSRAYARDLFYHRLGHAERRSDD